MSQDRIKYDVIVVGAGPAGSVAASTVARHGLSVLLIDKKQRIGEKPHCGEFIPKKLLGQFQINSGIIDQTVDSMETLLIGDSADPGNYIGKKNPGALLSCTDNGFLQSGKITGPTEADIGESILTQSEGFIIDRQSLDMSLAKNAASNGAIVLSDCKLSGLANQKLLFRHRGREIEAESRVVIGADGSNSLVGKVLSSWRPEFLLGIQFQVPLSKELDRTIIFFHKSITYGYGWLFPKGTSANLGLGFMPRKHSRPFELLEFFVEMFINLGLVRRGILSKSRGLIPVSGIRNELVRGNLALVGDAAGLTHPITGAGAPQAMVSGELAAMATVKAIKNADMNCLSSYESEIRGLYSGVLNHAKSKRKLMIDKWPVYDMKSICSQTWIACEGYRKRVRNI